MQMLVDIQHHSESSAFQHSAVILDQIQHSLKVGAYGALLDAQLPEPLLSLELVSGDQNSA
jgi:hypothetical protein